MKKGWTETKLGEVCEFEGGSQPPKSTFSTVEKEGYVRLIQIRDYKTDKHKVYIPLSKARRFCKKDDIMIGRYGPPVFQILEGLEGAYNVAMMKAIPNKEKVTRDYIFLFLQHDAIQQHIINLSQRASGQTGISVDALKAFPIKFPLIPEQQRIVSVLDEAFASITQAKSNAEQNLVNARELFETYLESLFTNPHKGWEEKTLVEIIDSNVIGLVKNSREQGVDKEYKYVKMNNITPSNNFDFSKYTCVDATKDEVEKYNLADGDFLFNTRNSKELVGKTCIYTSVDDSPVLFNNNIMRIRFTKTINSSFINYQFSTKLLQEKLNLMKSGTTNVSAIYYKNLQYLPLLIPPLAEQRAIVGRLEALSAETGRLQEIYQSKINNIEELKKSILAKAFSGEL